MGEALGPAARSPAGPACRRPARARSSRRRARRGPSSRRSRGSRSRRAARRRPTSSHQSSSSSRRPPRLCGGVLHLEDRDQRLDRGVGVAGVRSRRAASAPAWWIVVRTLGASLRSLLTRRDGAEQVAAEGVEVGSLIGFQPATRSPKVSPTQSTWRLHTRRPCLSSRKPCRSSANHPGSVKWWRQTQIGQPRVAPRLEDRAVALDLLLVVVALRRLEAGPVERQPVVGEAVLGVEREVLGVPGGEPVPVAGRAAPARRPPSRPVAAGRRALGLRRRRARAPHEPVRPVARHGVEPSRSRRSWRHASSLADVGEGLDPLVRVERALQHPLRPRRRTSGTALMPLP